MYLLSRYAGWGRNLWMSVNDGTIEVNSKDEHFIIKVKGSIAVQQIHKDKDKSTNLIYGQECKVSKADKIVEENYFQPGTLRAIKKGSLYRRQTGVSLCGSKGMVECFSTSSGACGKEVFRYGNGIQAYIATIWKKTLLLKRPNGRLWMTVLGKVCLNSCSSIAEKLDAKESDFGLRGIMRNRDWGLTIYDTDGVSVVTQGQVKNGQKQDKWLENGKTVYYLSGVKVSRQLYEESPDKWDAYEVLKIPNAQLRCSLLTKMGYDKLIEKVKPRVIESFADGGALLEIDTKASKEQPGIDKIMRMVKVVCPSTGQTYVLRVPPAIAGYEQARQWTFGLREESIRQGASLELAKET